MTEEKEEEKNIMAYCIQKKANTPTIQSSAYTVLKGLMTNKEGLCEYLKNYISEEGQKKGFTVYKHLSNVPSDKYLLYCCGYRTEFGRGIINPIYVDSVVHLKTIFEEMLDNDCMGVKPIRRDPISFGRWTHRIGFDVQSGNPTFFRCVWRKNILKANVAECFMEEAMLLVKLNANNDTELCNVMRMKLENIDTNHRLITTPTTSNKIEMRSVVKVAYHKETKGSLIHKESSMSNERESYMSFDMIRSNPLIVCPCFVRCDGNDHGYFLSLESAVPSKNMCDAIIELNKNNRMSGLELESITKWGSMLIDDGVVGDDMWPGSEEYMNVIVKSVYEGRVVMKQKFDGDLDESTTTKRSEVVVVLNVHRCMNYEDVCEKARKQSLFIKNISLAFVRCALKKLGKQMSFYENKYMTNKEMERLQCLDDMSM